jgi:hypothetical protein
MFFSLPDPNPSLVCRIRIRILPATRKKFEKKLFLFILSAMDEKSRISKSVVWSADLDPDPYQNVMSRIPNTGFYFIDGDSQSTRPSETRPIYMQFLLRYYKRLAPQRKKTEKSPSMMKCHLFFSKQEYCCWFTFMLVFAVLFKR